MITSKELATKVKAMREAQNEYFRTKQFSCLDKARKIEREVDGMVNEVLTHVDAIPGNLFNQKSE